MIIYKITNTVTGMAYIGQTRQTLNARFASHKSKAKNSNSRSLLHEAIREYGNEAFTAEILEVIEDESMLNSREIYWIEHEKTLHPNGYNTSKGGEVENCHYKHSENTKEKMRNMKKGKFQKENNPFYGHHHTEKTRAIMSEKAKRRVVTDEWRTNIYKSRKRKPVINLDTGEVFVSARHACRYYGKDPDSGTAGAIANVCNKKPKYKTAIGYRFEYYNPDVHDNTVPSLKHIEEGVTTIRKE